MKVWGFVIFYSADYGYPVVLSDSLQEIRNYQKNYSSADSFTCIVYAELSGLIRCNYDDSKADWKIWEGIRPTFARRHSITGKILDKDDITNNWYYVEGFEKYKDGELIEIKYSDDE